MGHGEGGCGGDGEGGDHHAGGHELGPPTGAQCPEGLTLTYETFGRSFVESYCLRCHSANVTGTAREGAPSDSNCDTLVEIQDAAEHIDGFSGIGPDASNEAMPPDGPKPTEEERERLAEWLACGAP